jgi:heptosyltransferase-2
MSLDLIVRLPNHLGDACMALPTLELLATRGRVLSLVGPPWAGELFAAYPWRFVRLHGARRQRVAALRRRFHNGTPALLLTNSFGSALEFWLADLRSTGFSTELRRPLLWHPVRVPAASRERAEPPMHMVEYYYELARALVDDAPPLPPSLSLKLPSTAHERARDMLRAAGLGEDFVVLCPVAIGKHKGKIKAWDGFGGLCDDLIANGVQVAACPGPGERDAVAAVIPEATLLPETDVATFAALLAACRLVVANDSGAAHIAAAVGARLVTVFGVTDARRTGPWSPRAVGVGSASAWPSFNEVIAAVYQQLSFR